MSFGSVLYIITTSVALNCIGDISLASSYQAMEPHSTKLSKLVFFNPGPQDTVSSKLGIALL